ncbi:coenzyme F420-0:L-glutamate ligase [Patescibacteria group bacterium]
MRVIPLHTQRILPGDDALSVVLEILAKKNLKKNDVICISSKIFALGENRVIKLSSIKPSSRANTLAHTLHMNPSFVQCVLNEADSVHKGVRGALLTLKNGIPIANAGIDQSNTPFGYVVLWPKSPARLAEKVNKAIFKRYKVKTGVIITDSSFITGRKGTIGIAVAISGFEGVRDEKGKKDLFNKRMQLTSVDVADSLATVANIAGGERNEQTPVVLIRDANITLSSMPSLFLTKQLTINRSKDLFFACYYK